MAKRILIVEDNDSLRDVLVSVLQTEGFDAAAAPTGEKALDLLEQGEFDCLLADFKLPGMHGIEFLKAVRERRPTVPFLLMTAYGSIDLAVAAMKQGANDFICKPFEPRRLVSVLQELLAHQRVLDRNPGVRDRAFIGQHPSVTKVLHQARKVAAVDSSVLLLGESGTGKELLARFIHAHSPRNAEQFIAVNCAALPPDLLESEFFGHEAGAFTGATQTRIGVFELAAKGTIFLDEIGEMPASLQVKLLRALQEREIKRLGGSRTIRINPRIVAATNCNIERALECGALRDDLYFRLAVVTLDVPPLRDRKCDIGLLVRYYLEYFGSRLQKQVELDPVAHDLLMAYQWPGNARELENVIERAMILCDRIIRPEHLGITVGLDLQAIDEANHSLVEIGQRAARKAEMSSIARALERTHGNKSKASQLLGVSYKTLLNKIKEYGLEPAAHEEPAASGETESKPAAPRV